jgi:hypothetical protein
MIYIPRYLTVFDGFVIRRRMETIYSLIDKKNHRKSIQMCYEILENLKKENVMTDLTENDTLILTENVNTIIDNIKDSFRCDTKIKQNVMKALDSIKEY